MEAPNYLFFVATFADGSQIFQNIEDKSETTEGRTCYFDVLQRQIDVPLVCFVLAGDGYPTFGVDLRDGHFEINGVPFFQHNEPFENFRLHYFRNVSQHRTIAAGGDAVDSAELGYSLGWTTEHDGKPIERFMRITR
jgi:hypothetical protein